MDLIVGRMILYPGHWIHYMIFWNIYGICYLWYLMLSNSEDWAIVIVNALKIAVLGNICFVLTSTLTYIRSNRLDVWPLMYGYNEMADIAAAGLSMPPPSDMGTDVEKQQRPEPIEQA